MPVLLADLAAGAGLTLKLLPPAAEAVSGRAVAAMVRGLPLADLLDALTEPYGLTWAIAGHDLHVLAEPTDPTALRARARKALKRAAVAEPDHVWVPATLIELGHLDVADGHWPEAAAWYARTVKEYPLGNEGALAAYNWGLTYMNAGDRTKAREQFLNVADRDGPAAALAFWWAGRTHLDCGDTVQAAKLFRRAIAAGADTPAATAAAIGLCVCLYQQDDFAAGHAALRPHKARLKGEGYKETAAFLDALGRQRLAANPKKTGEAEDLFLATVDAPAVSAAGPAGAYLHGQTCRELGLGPRLVAVYETAAAGLRGPLAVRLTAAVAEQHFADGNRAKARDRFLAVAAVDSGPDGKIARLRLAEMDNDTGRFDSALGLCRELIALGDREDATLKQMGRAFEGKKDFARAAQSYAGVVPE